MWLRWLSHHSITMKLTVGFGLVGIIITGISRLDLGRLGYINGSIGGVLLSLGIGYSIARSINRSLRQVTTAIEQASIGDFSARVVPTTDKELDRMGRALNQLLTRIEGTVGQVTRMAERGASWEPASRIQHMAQDRLERMGQAISRTLAHCGDILRKVSATTCQVSRTSQRLATGNEQLSIGVQEQAVSLKDTAMSLRHMTRIVQQSINDIRTVNRMAVEAQGGGERGVRTARQAVGTMQDVMTIARRAAERLTAIDEIAALANLLASCVAGESVRTEKEDRGFTVIAEELRALAQRSASASKEIRTLMNDAVARVQGSVTLVNQSGDAFTEVVTVVNKAASLIVTISEAAQKQTQQIGQINNIVTQMGRVTRRNAVHATELRLTISALVAQAGNLSTVVDDFRPAQRDMIGSQRSIMTSQATHEVTPPNTIDCGSSENRKTAAAITESAVAQEASEGPQPQSLQIAQHWLASELQVRGWTN